MSIPFFTGARSTRRSCTGYPATPPAASALVNLGAKTRYRMPDAALPRRIYARRARCRATFAEPQWAPTPGQYLVLYDGDVCLGGAVITAPASAAATTTKPEARAAV